jgi:hypothetical protein
MPFMGRRKSCSVSGFKKKKKNLENKTQQGVIPFVQNGKENL